MLAPAMTRDDGMPAQVGDTVRIEGGRVHFDAPEPRCLETRASTVPNRLYGTTINEHGEAV